jgi:hypothetical protein
MNIAAIIKGLQLAKRLADSTPAQWLRRKAAEKSAAELRRRRENNEKQIDDLARRNGDL